MKRIIDGKTYNTETATLIAGAQLQQGELKKSGSVFQSDYISSPFDILYQTRHGVYFRYHGDWNYNGAFPSERENITPLSPPEAQAWMEKNNFTNLIEHHFGEQPEAGEAESRLTIRIPDSLKSRIEQLASNNNQSLNAWVMRCLENCANTKADGR